MKLRNEIEDSVNRILGRYVVDMNAVPETTGKVYAVGKRTVFRLGMKYPQQSGTAEKDANRENRCELELKEEIKAATMDIKDEQ